MVQRAFSVTDFYKLSGIGKGNNDKETSQTLQISWYLIKFKQFFMCLVVSSLKLGNAVCHL